MVLQQKFSDNLPRSHSNLNITDLCQHKKIRNILALHSKIFSNSIFFFVINLKNLISSTSKKTYFQIYRQKGFSSYLCSCYIKAAAKFDLFLLAIRNQIKVSNLLLSKTKKQTMQTIKTKKQQTEPCSELCQTSKKQRLVKIFNGFMPLTLFAKRSILDV